MISSINHPNINEVAQFSISHPQRHYVVDIGSYNLSTTEIKGLLKNRFSVCIKKSDGISNTDLLSLIKVGKDRVIVLPTGFPKTKFSEYIKKGASTILKKEGTFQEDQIRYIADLGKNRVTVIGTDLSESDLKDYLSKEAVLSLCKTDLSVFAVSRLTKLGKEKIQVNITGFTEFRMNKFLENKAIIIIDNTCTLARFIIERKVKKYKQQIHLSANYVNDTAWIDKMENLGAVII